MLRLLLTLLFVGAPLALAAPPPPEDDAARIRRIYGTLSNPNRDASVSLEGTKLRINLPAQTEYPSPNVGNLQDPVALRAARGAAVRAVDRQDPRPEGAACVWREVTGDFTVVVRVSFTLRTETPNGSTLTTPRAAGLVIHAAANDHVGIARVEDAARQRSGEGVRLGYTHAGRVRRAQARPSDEGAGLYLRLKRDGQNLTAAYSRDGKVWDEFFPDEVEWPATVKVGVYAKNYATVRFAPAFEEYHITRPKK